MDLNATGLFTSRQIGRLVRLRSRYDAGRWPKPFAEVTRSELFPIEMRAESPSEDENTHVHCTLTRIDPASNISPVMVWFQIPREDDRAPDADEVLRWLAIGAVDLEHEEATGHLEIMFHLMSSRSRGLPYRGLVVTAETMDDFRFDMAANASAVAELLGEKALAYLVKDLIRN